MFEGFKAPLTAATRYCAIFGHPVRHSASPAMQGAAMAALGLDWRYLAFEVRVEELRVALDGAKAMGFLGLNLTVPHKLAAMEMVDALDETARTWGAVNTVRFEGRDARGDWKPLHEFGGKLPAGVRSHGFNTDADGLAISLKEDLGLKLPGAKAVVVGAGGAGQVAALKLASEGVGELFLVNRTVSKAVTVAKEVQARFPAVNVVVGYPKMAVDLLLNATSLGLKPGDELPVNEHEFALKNARAVYDMNYRPAETALLAAAKAAGCRVANGVGMLVGQGAVALELWSGQTPSVKIMRDAAVKSIYGN